MSIEVASGGAVRTAPRVLLRAEGAAVLAGAAWAYSELGASWWIFAALFLAPDISLLSYLRNAKLGAIVYNAAHTYLSPALLLAGSTWLGLSAVQAVALVWIAHVGFDRMAGYGLKYATSFHATHLGWLGRSGSN